MKTPRLEDFDQTPKRPVRELHSPIDDMPRIQRPQSREQSERRQHDDIAVSPGDEVAASPPRRTTSKRLLIRRGFDYYDDQLIALKKLSLQEQMAGRDGSMSRMLRDALDQYLTKQRPNPDTSSGATSPPGDIAG